MTKFENLKATTKRYAPVVVSTAAVSVAATAIVIHRIYNPKDKVAIQLPKGALEKLHAGTGLALNTNEGWFTLKYHPQD